MDIVINQLDALSVLTTNKGQQINQVIDECEKKLGSNANTEKEIPQAIINKLDFKREDATIGLDQHQSLS